MGKKGKKTKEKKSTPAEAFIQFQIEVRKKEIDAYEEEIKELEARNKKLLELRDQLRDEQQGHLSVLHKQIKAQEKKLEENEVANNEQIQEAIQSNVELARTQEDELEELHRKLISVQTEVVEMQAQLQSWQLYMNVDSVEHQKKIGNLESELESVQKKFQAMTVNIECALKAAISKIENSTTQLVEREKQMASERALKQADDNSLQEIKKNDWLKKEIAVYYEEVSVLDAAVKNLERENLTHMKELLEFRRIDAQMSRSGMLMQTVSEQKLSLPETEAEIEQEEQQSEELEEDKINGSSKSFSPTLHLDAQMHGSQSDLRKVSICVMCVGTATPGSFGAEAAKCGWHGFASLSFAI
ncbi:Coiled-coil domain-containing protein 83 [Bagarius yarrelli]|uniref:Coiled-coil domain-containing protein 83 n=1 Tax=Bagarius yarrelli TaxID=175774 RepID=A0A556TJZ1_BAGYA|nr:Coiled-coil domain-containing protein 83 [Bagarius yarrelli]